MFKEILSIIDKDTSLQIVSIDSNKHNVEKLLFERELHDIYFVDCIERVNNSLKLLKTDGNFEDFKITISSKIQKPIIYECDLHGLSCIRYLAHSYYKNEILPEEWRKLVDDKN